MQICNYVVSENKDICPNVCYISIMTPLDPGRKLPTRREPKDPRTTNAMVNPTDKVMVRGVARSIVSVSSIARLNYFTNLYQGSPIELFLANDKFRIYVCRWVKERSQCTGIIMGQRESNRKQHNLVVTCSKFISSRESKLLDPLPKVYIKPCSVKFHFMEWANGFVLVCFRSYRGWIFVA